jgi:hypothetical protein
VDVPGNGLLRNLAVLPQVFERVGAGSGIVLLIGEVGGLLGGLVLQAQAAVQDGQVVMRGEVVRVDGLDRFVFRAG